MSITLTRRAALAGLALSTLALATPLTALAQAWPTQPVRIIVPFPPGGGADTSARALGEALGPKLGQAVIVENKPGAGSAIGVNAAAQARDRHTLLMGSNSMVINPSLQEKIGYDMERDFDAVGMVSKQPMVLVVPAESTIQSVEDLIAQAKADPGKLTAGNSGNGTLAHIASEMLASETGIEITTVPYRGENALVPDLIGGFVAFGFVNLPSAFSHVQSGRLRALAVSSAEERTELPGVPTLRSLGYPNLEVEGWAVLVAPHDTIPAEGLERLETLLAEALTSEAVASRLQTAGVTPTVLPRAETEQLLKAEGQRYADVIKARGIRAE